jgi:hypothetical protein
MGLETHSSTASQTASLANGVVADKELLGSTLTSPRLLANASQRRIGVEYYQVFPNSVPLASSLGNNCWTLFKLTFKLGSNFGAHFDTQSRLGATYFNRVREADCDNLFNQRLGLHMSMAWVPMSLTRVSMSMSWVPMTMNRVPMPMTWVPMSLI